MSTCTIALDPGVNGGIAYGVLPTPVLETMPDTPHDLAARIKHIICGAYLPVHAVLEEVGGYVGGAGQPGSAMFTFGKGYGTILGVLAALEVPIVLVRPQKWQKVLGLGTSTGMTKSAWKNKLKARAQQLYPGNTITLKTADACLIWHAAQKGLV